MAEEIENAAINVPRAITTTLILNGAMGWAMLLATLFCLGDVESVLVCVTQSASIVEVLLTRPTEYPDRLSIHTNILQRDWQGGGYGHDHSHGRHRLVCRHWFLCHRKPDDVVICKGPRPAIPSFYSKGLSRKILLFLSTAFTNY